MHTPGPWTAAYNGDPVCVGDSHGNFVAMTLAMNEDIADAEDYANALLCAAAPTLLAALRDAENYAELKIEGFRRDYPEDHAMVQRPLRLLATIRDAIRLATKES